MAYKKDPQDRHYNEIWEVLKKTRYCRVDHPRSKHASLAVLIRREANKDAAFKTLLDSIDKKFFINYTSLGNVFMASLRIEARK